MREIVVREKQFNLHDRARFSSRGNIFTRVWIFTIFEEDASSVFHPQRDVIFERKKFRAVEIQASCSKTRPSESLIRCMISFLFYNVVSVSNYLKLIFHCRFSFNWIYLTLLIEASESQAICTIPSSIKTNNNATTSMFEGCTRMYEALEMI